MAQKFIVPITVRQLASAGSDAFTIYVDQDVYSRIQIQAGGRIVWGSGAAALDTNLYRDAANVLKTDDTFKAAGLFVSGTEIDPAGAASDQVLKFNGTKFVPGTVSTVGLLNDLTDVTTASVAVGDVLTWNGTYWTNEEPTGGGASVTVSESAPAAPAAGDLWFDSILGVMFIYYDDVWVEVGGGGVVNFVLDTVTAKGDLIVGTADGAADNLAVGSNGTYLKANSSTATGLEWASVPTVNAAAIISAAGGDGTNGQALTTNGAGTLDFTTIVGTTEASIISAVGADGAAGSVLKTNGSGDLSFGDVALGTNTSGNYVASLVAGTGITLSNNSGETATPTVTVDTSVIQARVTNVTDTEIGYLDGVTSGVQGQIDTKAPLASPTFTGTVTLPDNTVALGTKTTGDYVSSLVAGTGITLSNNSGETATPTIAIGQAVGTSASVTFANLTVSGDLTVSGTTTSINTETLTVDDNIVVLNNNVTASPTENAGIEVERGTSPNVLLRWNESTDKWEFTNDGSTYSNLGAGGATISASAPASPTEGQIWFNSTTLETYVYYDSHWLQASGEPDLVEDLTDLSDVLFTTPVSGQFLKFDGTRWVNGTIPTINTLDDIGDVVAPSPTDGYFLKYVSASSSWVPAEIPTINALDDIGNVSASAPSSGQFLKWNGSAWVADTIVGGASISDTAPASPSAGQIWFQSTNGKTFVYYDSQWIEVGGVGTGARMVSSSSAPASPLEGSMWFDTDTAQTFVYYDSQWIEIGASGVTASVQDTAPADPVSGQIWFNSLTGGTFVYYGTNWIEVGASPFSALINTINAKGDLLVGTADNTLGGLTAGSANQVLTVDSSTATGLKWSTPTTYATTGKAIAMSIVFGG